MDFDLKNAIAAYGWTATGTDDNYQLYNRLDKMVCTVCVKKGRYRFMNTQGQLILSGKGDFSNAAVKVLKEYFYATCGAGGTI